MVLKPAWLDHGVIALFACLLCIHGCSTVYQGGRTPTDSDKQLPTTVELSQTPFFPQTRHHCGPAALATLLQTYDVEVTPDDLSSQVYLPHREGSLQVEMAVAARRYAMLPYPLEPAFNDLLREIAAGNPVLVLQNLGFGWWPRWHYAVVIGYDLDAQELILRSGTTRRWLTSFYAFDNTWQRAGRWALVIVPAGEVPASARVSVYLKTAYAFEETGLEPAALDAYRAATRRWPEDSNTWLTLGNMALNVGNTAEAVAALLNASQLNPHRASIWNNLAYALHASGCAEQALQSLQCAYRLAPEDRNIRDSEQELRARPVAQGAQPCPLIHCN